MSDPAKLLVDTDVMVGYLRGKGEAVTFLESLEGRPATSVICVAELISGVRSKAEREAIERFLLAFELLAVDEGIARLGGEYRQRYRGTHGTGLADALVAATAASHSLVLTTFNAKHYPMLAEVLVPYQQGSV